MTDPANEPMYRLAKPRSFIAVMQHPDVDAPPTLVEVVTYDDHEQIVSALRHSISTLLAGRTPSDHEPGVADQSPAASPGGQSDGLSRGLL